MAIVKNVGKHAVILSSGLDLGLLQTANVDPAAPNEAAMIAAGILIITDGSVSPSPPASPPPLGIPGFQAFTKYPAGYVIIQAGALYQAVTGFTSVGSFSAGDWTAVTTGLPAAVVSAASHPFTKLEASGHSYTTGGGATAGHGFVQKLSAILNLTGGNYVNRGNGGAMVCSDEQGPVAGKGWAYTLGQLSRTNGGSPFLPASSLYVVDYGCVDIAWLGTSAAVVAQIRSAMRTVLSRIRASATGVFEETDSSVAASGFATATMPAGTSSGGGALYHNGTGGTITISVPSSYPGSPIALGFCAYDGQGALHTVTVDGNNVGQFDTRGLTANFTSQGKSNIGGHVYRLTNLSPGSHTIVITDVAHTNNTFFDYWQIEAPDPPTILLMLQPRLTANGYAQFSSPTYPGGPPTDVSVQMLNTMLMQLAAEFDRSVIPVSPDPLFQANASMFSSPGTDYAHPSDAGHSVLADLCLRAAQSGPWLPALTTAS